MREYAFGDFRVEIDEEAPRDYYADSIEWDCTCAYCRNFVFLARERKLPEDMLELLDKLGIPPEKATYAYEVNGEDVDLLYFAIYRVSGRIVDEPEPVEEWKPEIRKGFMGWIDRLYALLGHPRKKKWLRYVSVQGKLEGGTEVWCVRQEYPSSAKNFPEPGFDLGFAVTLQWKDGIPLQSNDIIISSDLEENTTEIENLLREVIPAVLRAENIYYGCEINVLLTDDAGIHAINLEQRGVDAPTDVLSFPMFDLKPGDKPSEADADPATHLIPLGDMVLNLDRIRSQGEEYGHGEKREAAYLAVHSVLHLLGYDHMDDGPMKAQMRAREEIILNKVGMGR